jgi:predicted secreted protein
MNKARLAIFVCSFALIAFATVFALTKTPTYTFRQNIHTRVGKDFIIAVSNPGGTGAGWEAKYDEDLLGLVDWWPEEEEPGMCGGEVKEHFKFKALQGGETEITLVWKRPWEENWVEKRVFRVYIK